MIIFDTETTNLIKSMDLPDEVQPRIIELYAMKIDASGGWFDLKPGTSEGLEFVCDPGVEVTEEIQKIDASGGWFDLEPGTYEELEFVCDPGVEVTEEIQKITGITPADVKGQPPFGMFLNDLQQFFLGEELVIGHNVTFDLDMLTLELRRLEAVTRFPWPPHRLCTVEATEHLEGRRLNLTNLHKRLFNGEGFQAHRAKSDVMATFRCLRELVTSGQVTL